MMKTIAGVAGVAALMLTCGCHTDPGMWGAMAAGGAQGASQYNQQLMLQQQQENTIFMQQQQERLAAIRAQNEARMNAQQQQSDSKFWNPQTGTYQYVPPGWHASWDPQSNTWVIQP